MLDAAQYLADHIHEAPVWIVPCLEGANPTRTAISPASRSKGLGQDHRCLDKRDDATADRPVGDAERLDLPVGCWIAVQERGIGSWAYIALGLTR
jgi:hypothetical protein